MLINFVDATNDANHYTKPPCLTVTVDPSTDRKFQWRPPPNSCCRHNSYRLLLLPPQQPCR